MSRFTGGVPNERQIAQASAGKQMACRELGCEKKSRTKAHQFAVPVAVVALAITAVKASLLGVRYATFAKP